MSDPVGTIVKYTGMSSTVPKGYLHCNGAEVSRTDYADLFAVIGTTYGPGNGTTTFNVPLLKDSDGNYCLIKAEPGVDATDITDADGSPVGNIIKVIGTVDSLAGYLKCDGRAVSRSEYADLFAVIGTTYGEGDGTTTFALPNNQETGYTYFIKTEAEETPASNDAPTGTVTPFVSEGEVPEGYMLCDGSAVNRIEYSKLFALIGTSYGVGDNVTTFNLPTITDSDGNYFIIKVGDPSEGDATIGQMTRYVGKTIPTGYLECDGTTVSRAQYADLFAVIGETYGSGDGSTTFTLPNLKDSQNTYTYIIKTVADAGPIDARGLYPHIYVTVKTAGATVTVTSNGASAEYETDPDTGIRDYVIPTNGEWIVNCSYDGRSRQQIVDVTEVKIYSVTAATALLYGYRIKENEADPYTRVEYIEDAVGMTPAHMDFTNNVFDYGSWEDAWFIRDNHPCVMKFDGTIDYYLNDNDYTKKADGTASTITTSNTTGNVMAQIPLCWVKRWSENGYNYVLISDVQYDSDFKAYAHTDANGNIKDYFYYSCYGGYKDGSNKMRSLSGVTMTGSLTAANELTYCRNNGTGWCTHTWSQRSLIIDLLVLIGKSTNGQAVFGWGNANGYSTSILITGTLNNKGRFYGKSEYASKTTQVKVFHIEKFWADMYDRVAGLITKERVVYAKMTPENGDYNTDATGYTNTNITLRSDSNSYTISMTCTEWGLLPSSRIGGSATTYYADYSYIGTGMKYLSVGGMATATPPAPVGPFAFDAHNDASNTYSTLGCGLSYV